MTGILSLAADGILLHSAGGVLEEANPRAETLFGLALEGLRRLRLTDLAPPSGRQALRDAEDEAAQGRVIQLETELKRRSGEYFTARVTLGGLPLEGRILIQTHVRDLSENKATERRLRRAEMHDPATGLPNRRALVERLHGTLDRAARRSDRRFALLAIGLERLAAVTEGHGRATTTRALQEIVRRQRAAAPRGWHSRLGDTTFAVLLEEIDGVLDAREAADRIAHALAEPIEIGERRVFLGASVGIVTSADAPDSAEDCLRDADIALEHARDAGSGEHRVFDPVMHARLRLRLDLESALRHREGVSQIVPHYQPLIEIATGRIVEVEALARWHHPDQGILGPGTFLPLVAELGLDGTLDDHMLFAACCDLQLWTRRAQGEASAPDRVAVNISSRRFANPNLVPTVEATLEAVGLEPSQLRLEVTEGATIGDAEAAAGVLGDLRDLGVHVSLDDFGTGYSSLGYLHRLPIDTLKIDRSFVSGPSERSPVLEAAVGLAHGLGMKVVAEGVETPEDLERVTRLGCEMAQGFYFSRPVEASAVPALRLPKASATVSGEDRAAG